MAFRRYTFEFWPTLIAIPMFIALLSLGFWQLHRLHLKDELLSNIHSKIESDPIHFPHKITNLKDMQYSKYTLHGDFLYEKNMFLYGGNPSNPSEHGYFVMTPFVTDHGMHILVNRGWIFPTKIDAFLSKNPSYEPTEITAVLMIPNEPSDLLPKNDTRRNIWFSVDLETMSRFVVRDLEKSFYMTLIQGDHKASKDLTKPSAQDFFVHIKNDHLIYAITWFSLAIGLAWIYIAYHRK